MNKGQYAFNGFLLGAVIPFAIGYFQLRQPEGGAATAFALMIIFTAPLGALLGILYAHHFDNEK